MGKRFIVLWVMLLIITGCSAKPIPEPERCSICADLSRHAPCIINLSTGEKLELDVYEPHPFIVGEIAEEQPGGYFSFVRGAGAEGYKVGAEYVVITIPVESEKMNQQYFCNFCRELLAGDKKSGYVLVDLINPNEPVIYPVNSSTSFSIRCYSILIQENTEENEYEITVTGHYSQP